MKKEVIEKRRNPGETAEKILSFLESNGEQTRKSIYQAVGVTPDESLSRLFEKGCVDYRHVDGIRDRFWFFVTRVPNIKAKRRLYKSDERQDAFRNEQKRLGRKSRRIFMTDDELSRVLVYLDGMRNKA